MKICQHSNIGGEEKEPNFSHLWFRSPILYPNHVEKSHNSKTTCLSCKKSPLNMKIKWFKKKNQASYFLFLFSNFVVRIFVFKIIIFVKHSPTKNRSFSFRKLNSTFYHSFSAANYNSLLSFFPARQVSEKILNESSKSTGKCSNWVTPKTYNKIFPQIQSIW
jgi:hypothetical protein